MKLRREAFWALVLTVIAFDLWWSTTPLSFEWWWVPLIALNLVVLGLVLYPTIVGRD